TIVRLDHRRVRVHQQRATRTTSRLRRPINIQRDPRRTRVDAPRPRHMQRLVERKRTRTRQHRPRHHTLRRRIRPKRTPHPTPRPTPQKPPPQQNHQQQTPTHHATNHASQFPSAHRNSPPHLDHSHVNAVVKNKLHFAAAGIEVLSALLLPPFVTDTVRE